MKKIYSLLLIAAATIGITTSCSDVPMPYDINEDGSISFGKKLPYKSASLSTFTSYDLKPGYPAWSPGSSYTQATGYQKWNGAADKSNQEVESYLISPALNTNAPSGKVRISFDQTIRYTNNVNNWEKYHKIYISKNFDGNSVNFNNATWTELPFTPEASPYTDWTLYSSGYIQIPDEFVNHDSVYIAFYFYAPASASTTWELENFMIEEGSADGGNGGSGDNALPYKNANLQTFSTYDLKNTPWSQGASYTQATGYQKWNGAADKSNKEVEGYLISPSLTTKCESGKVRLSFDNTIKYTNNVSNWQNYHKVYVSKNYDGNVANFNNATWTPLSFTPVASPHTDWTLYSSGQIQIPDEFVNQDAVYFAFYFYAPETGSTTWEITNFLLEEGVAEGGNDNPNPSETNGSKAAPLSVSAAKAVTSGNGYVTGYIVGYIDGQKLDEGARFSAASASETEILIADSPSETNTSNVFPVQLPAGDLRTALNPSIATNIGKKVVLYGSFEKYFGVQGMKSTTWALLDGQSYGTDPDAEPVPIGEQKGDGTQANPFNVAAALAFTNALPADQKSEAKYIEGIICSVPSIDTGDYGNAKFYISDDGTDANKFQIYNAYDIGNQHFTDANKLKKGDKVVVYGPLVNYRGNTPETVTKEAYLISINGSTGEGGSDPTPDDPTPTPGSSDGISISGTTVTLTNAGITAGSESITIDLSTFGYANAAVVSTVSVSDGTTIEFAAGTNSNAPKYYDATNGVRVYANNTITFNGHKTIAKVVMTCDSYNGTDYVGNTTATLSASGNSLVYNNASTAAGVQLRVKTITITYAN